ncbi:hypothetical protein GCM10010961_22730 [Pseudodonghicola xiamenensis]|uniref:Uncharacterized protein n=1 Tax=Pseudodonghicola xiamenensis TaxID=337702 RepID=A0A8J3MCG4_9RHOB|nr:hypothetical protein GCM10010961_22730 [Pseudodonghicola xiamenensis]
MKKPVSLGALMVTPIICGGWRSSYWKGGGAKSPECDVSAGYGGKAGQEWKGMLVSEPIAQHRKLLS